MQATFLGKVTVASAGTPVPLSTDPTLRACAILVATIPGLTGNVYLGGGGLDRNSLAGVMIVFNAPSVSGPADSFLLEVRDGHNSLQLSEYFLDASVSGEGALITYFQI
ncbi:MAG TPA: hypothetical protein VMT32_06650 [Bryobacteraceae bacterium]|nr:hypothetical protein [Bryobacteraceae bacterium]